MMPMTVTPEWQAQAHAWIHAEMERLGQPVCGQIEQQRVMPWSTVLRVPTGQGQVYFKASRPALGHEPGLTAALYRWRPDCMVRVLAVNRERRWMLMADEGVTLRSLLQSAADLSRWEALLPRFAEVQIEMAARQEELLQLGVFDRRLEQLPGLYEQLIHDRAALRLGQDGGLSETHHARLLDFAPQYAGMCRRLAEYPVPESLHHDDFHDGNIYVQDGRSTFSDWGESCLAHPFFSLVITLRSIADRLGLPETAAESPDSLAPELNRLRDLYLGPWERFAPLESLRQAFSLAWRVGMVNRALTWRHVLQHCDDAVRAEYGGAVPAWLQEFLLIV